MKAILPPPHVLTRPDSHGPLQYVHVDLFGPYPLHTNVKGDVGEVRGL
jgi:hypothetical protein